MASNGEQLDALLPLGEGHYHHFHMLLLTQERCGLCEQAREILERLASSRVPAGMREFVKSCGASRYGRDRDCGLTVVCV